MARFSVFEGFSSNQLETKFASGHEAFNISYLTWLSRNFWEFYFIENMRVLFELFANFCAFLNVNSLVSLDAKISPKTTSNVKFPNSHEPNPGILTSLQEKIMNLGEPIKYFVQNMDHSLIHVTTYNSNQLFSLRVPIIIRNLKVLATSWFHPPKFLENRYESILVACKTFPIFV